MKFDSLIVIHCFDLSSFGLLLFPLLVLCTKHLFPLLFDVCDYDCFYSLLETATGTGGGANARFEKLLASANQLRKEEAEETAEGGGAPPEVFVPWTANQKTPEEVCPST